MCTSKAGPKAFVFLHHGRENLALLRLSPCAHAYSASHAQYSHSCLSFSGPDPYPHSYLCSNPYPYSYPHTYSCSPPNSNSHAHSCSYSHSYSYSSSYLVPFRLPPAYSFPYTYSSPHSYSNSYPASCPDVSSPFSYSGRVDSVAPGTLGARSSRPWGWGCASWPL